MPLFLFKIHQPRFTVTQRCLTVQCVQSNCFEVILYPNSVKPITTEENQTINKSQVSTIKQLCIPPQVQEIILDETTKHHDIGSRVQNCQKYHEYNYVGLIDASCRAANVTSYTKLTEFAKNQESRANHYQSQVSQMQSSTAQQQQKIQQLQSQYQSIIDNTIWSIVNLQLCI